MEDKIDEMIRRSGSEEEFLREAGKYSKFYVLGSKLEKVSSSFLLVFQVRQSAGFKTRFRCLHTCCVEKSPIVKFPITWKLLPSFDLH